LVSLDAMKPEDLLWALAWFVAGLVTFRITSAKALLTLISGIAAAVSLFGLAFNPKDLAEFISRYPVDYIGGAVTNLVYLVGANLVRGDQFHKRVLWGRILMYAVLLVVLMIILKVFGPT
jgi:hypothetical protein